MRAILAISSHLDDCVLSMGQFLAGRPDVTVATVFATAISDEEHHDHGVVRRR